MAVLNNTGIRAGASGAGGAGYQIAKSLRFEGADGAKLTRTFAAGGDRKKWTYSYWIKRCGDKANHWYNSFFWAGAGLSGNLRFDDPTNSQMYGILASGVTMNTTRRFRDHSAWMHVTIVWDSNNSTAGDRFRLYIDGVRQTSFTAISAISEGLDSAFNGNEIHGIGMFNTNTGLKCYLADVIFVDGYAKDPGDFAETDTITGQWVPKEYGDSLVESVTNVASGFTYWAGMGDNWNGSGSTTSDTNDYINRALPSDGKVYWEVTLGTVATYENIGLQTGTGGLGTSYNDNTVGFYVNGNPPLFLANGGGGKQITHGGTSGTTWVAGKKLMFAWDSTGGGSNGKFYMGYDGTWYNSGNPACGTGACWTGMDTTASWYMKTGYASGDGTALTNVASASAEHLPGNCSTYYNKNSCHLKFDGTDLGEDSSGNDNDWTAAGLTADYGTPTTITAADTFSDDVTASGAFSGTRTADKMFVANRTDAADKYAYVASSSASSYITWTPATAITAHNGYVWISGGDGNGYGLDHSSKTVSINGSTATVQATRFPDSSANLRWYKFTVSGTFTSLKVEGDYPRINAVSFQAEPQWEGTHMVDGSAHMSNDPLYYDVSTDTPTTFDDDGNGTGNYCTLNPLASNGTLSQGNLYITGGSEHNAKSTMAFNTGKWYAEVKFTTPSSALYPGFGFVTRHRPFTHWNHIYKAPHQIAINGGGPNAGSMDMIDGDGTTTNHSGVYFDSSKTYQMALDMDNGKGYLGDGTTWFNSTWNTSGSAGNPATGANPTFTLDTTLSYYFWVYANGTNMDIQVNFGQRPFAYTPPSGFKAPNTFSLTDPTIKDPSEHFNSVLYTGTGSSGNAITGVGFEPDLVWCHRRDGINAPHMFNSLTGETKTLYTGYTDPEDPFSDFSFDSDGFTADGSAGGFNGNTNTYVSWNWDANTSGSNDASSTGIGTIDSTYKVNTDAGFSIVNYTGNNTNPASVAHGLNAVPAMILVKNRDTAGKDWILYHKGIGASKWVQHNLANAMVENTQAWNGTTPTSTVWTMQDRSDMNNTDDFTAFVWSEVEGYSKFGTYEGNGNVDGPMVYCGFRPAWVMLKNVDDGGNWVVLDNKRIGYNEENYALFYPVDASEYSSAPDADILSNGFKLRTTLGWRNADNKTHIFAAFAKSPFKYANAR